MQDAFIFDTQVDRGCPCLSESDASRLLSRIYIQLPALDPSCAFQMNRWAKVRIVCLGILHNRSHEHEHILNKRYSACFALVHGSRKISKEKKRTRQTAFEGLISHVPLTQLIGRAQDQRCLRRTRHSVFPVQTQPVV